MTNDVTSLNPFAALGFNAAAPVDPAAWEAELEQRSRDLIREGRRRDAERRFQDDCTRGYPESDWNHPKLAPYRAQIDRVLKWQNGPRGMLLSGPTGRGKTRAIFALYRRLAVEEVLDVRYYYAGDWFAKLQKEVVFGRDEASEWVTACAAHAIVIMDDLGQEAVLSARADWASAHFFRFLDLRIAKGLPLIVTTNLSAEEIAKTMGASTGIRQEPLIRRLLELGEVIKFS